MKTIYNKLVLALLVAIALVACGKQYDANAALGGGTNVHNHSSAATGGGSLNLTGSLGSSKACAVGFTRISPNYCSADTQIYTALTEGAVCTQAAAIPGASGVKAVFAGATVTSYGDSAVNVRGTLFQTFLPADSACASFVTVDQMYIQEFVGVATRLIFLPPSMNIIRSDTSGRFYYTFAITNNANTSSAGYLAIRGYFD